MNNFNSKFDLSYATLTNFETMDEWEIHGIVSDNSGVYFPSDSKVGDIIYINSYEGVKRYIVTEITSYSPEYVANVKWDMADKEPFEPPAGYEGLIGAKTGKLNQTSLTSWTINSLSESFINDIRNYESILMSDTTFNSPEFSGKPTAPSPDLDSNDEQIATTEWVNNKLKSLGSVSCEGEVKEFIAGEELKKFDLVYLTNQNKINKCNSNNVECADSIVGIVLDNCSIDNKVKVLMEGIITNEEWQFDSYPKTLFAGLDGKFIDSPNELHSFMQQIGMIVDEKTINLEIEESILF